MKVTPGDGFTPSELLTHDPPLVTGRISNIRPSPNSPNSTTVTISASERIYKTLYSGPVLPFGALVHVFGKANAGGWISPSRISSLPETAVGEEEIGEVIPFQVLASGVRTSNVGVLVCVEKVTTIRASLRVRVFDPTFSGTLTLWHPAAYAASSWKAFETALYITAPRFSSYNGGVHISLTSNSTLIPVPLSSAAAVCLRAHVLGAYPHTRASLGALEPEWPADGMKLLFTLSELDQCARKEKDRRVAGYLSLQVVGVELVVLWKRNMLFLGNCAGECVYSSTPQTHVCACGEDGCACAWVPNPCILTMLADETGCITGSALAVSERAWELLVPGLVDMNLQELCAAQARIEYARYSFAVVWDGEVGVLSVCDIS